MTESGVPKRSASAGGVASLDLQPPIGDREALVDPGGDGHPATLRDLLPGSFAGLTRRWSHGLIGQRRREEPAMNVIRTPAGTLRRRAAIGAVGLAALGGGVPQSRRPRSGDSPAAQNQAIAADAAGQLGVSATDLTAAIKKAMVDQVEAQVTAGTLTKAQATAIEARLARSDAPLFALGAGPGGRAITAAGTAGRSRSTPLQPSSASPRVTCAPSLRPARHWRLSRSRTARRPTVSRPHSQRRRSRISTRR